MGYRGQGLEYLELKDGSRDTGKGWDLLGKARSRARRWALLFLSSPWADDQGEEESDNCQGWHQEDQKNGNFGSFLSTALSST